MAADPRPMDQEESLPSAQVDEPVPVTSGESSAPPVDMPTPTVRSPSPEQGGPSSRVLMSPIKKNRRYLNVRCGPRLSAKAAGAAGVLTPVPRSSVLSGSKSSGPECRPPLAPFTAPPPQGAGTKPIPSGEMSTPASAPLPIGRVDTPPTASSALAPGSGSNSRGTQSPLASVYRQMLRSRGVDASAVDEASLEDLRLIMRFYASPPEGN
eukprot:GFKZ01012906.1.p2 GENE.GFKZ01012906.1~~GFKZ01012906.1.p2  ORF type:complete len:210 (-),score=14.30 GFKZ01012906.1:57-686(-)